jgi:hypothetical protein
MSLKYLKIWFSAEEYCNNLRIAFLEQELQVFCPLPEGAMMNLFSEQVITPVKQHTVYI